MCVTTRHFKAVVSLDHDMGVKKLQKEEKKKNVQRRVKAEEERNYDVVSRKREEKGTFVKAFLRFLFSQVGLVILCIVIAIGGTV